MFKKSLSLFLAVLMMLPLILTACNSGRQEPTTSDTTAAMTPGSDTVTGEIGTTVVPPIPDEPEHTITLASNGVSDYVIVRSETASSEEKNAVLDFRELFLEVTGVRLQITTDYNEPVEKEIIIGKTTRKDGNYTDLLKYTGENGYLFQIIGQKMIIAGDSLNGTVNGIRSFFESQFDCRVYSNGYGNGIAVECNQ